jgi:hypothetical protein
VGCKAVHTCFSIVFTLSANCGVERRAAVDDEDNGARVGDMAPPSLCTISLLSLPTLSIAIEALNDGDDNAAEVDDAVGGVVGAIDDVGDESFRLLSDNTTGTDDGVTMVAAVAVVGEASVFTVLGVADDGDGDGDGTGVDTITGATVSLVGALVGVVDDKVLALFFDCSFLTSRSAAAEVVAFVGRATLSPLPLTLDPFDGDDDGAQEVVDWLPLLVFLALLDEAAACCLPFLRPLI